MRASKYDDLVDEVDLLETNRSYPYIRHQDGRESTVNIRDLAPCPHSNFSSDDYLNQDPAEQQPSINQPSDTLSCRNPNSNVQAESEKQPTIRLPTEVSKQPKRSSRSNFGKPPSRLIDS